MSVHADLLPFSAAPPMARRRGTHVTPAASGDTPGSFVAWYMGLIPHWMGAEPRVKRRLLLRTHEWIVDRVLAPGVGLSAAATDLRPGGALTRLLIDLVPADEVEQWRHFIYLVIANLRHALLLPVTRRNEAWVRWLFLIPYSIKYAPEAAPIAVGETSPPAPRREHSCSGA